MGLLNYYIKGREAHYQKYPAETQQGIFDNKLNPNFSAAPLIFLPSL